MGKKRSWFSFVKRLFASDAKSKAEKKSKRWRWIFGRLKFKNYPELEAPDIKLSEAREEQRKHALAVAYATAAAAEAAVVAAHAAAEVVRLTGFPQSNHESERRARNLAAIKIQTAYRGHLARKALKALKGLVKLQAMVRGRIVRRQVVTKIKCFPIIPKTHSQIHQIRVPILDESYREGERKQFLSPRKLSEEKEMLPECSNQRNWNSSMFSKGDMEALWSKKQEAIVKREHMKKFSFSHRERRNDHTLEELITKENGRNYHHFEQSKAYRRRETEKLKLPDYSNLTASDTCRALFKLRSSCKHDLEEEPSSPFSLPRRSFCRAKQNSTGDESSLPNSPNFPAYMASTISTKAKARSMSTPRQRHTLFDHCCDQNSPYKFKPSSWSSFNGELSRNHSKNGTSQIMPSTKGHYRY